MFSSLSEDYPLILHVTFVTHQNNLGIIPRVCFDLSGPEKKDKREKNKSKQSKCSLINFKEDCNQENKQNTDFDI